MPDSKVGDFIKSHAQSFAVSEDRWALDEQALSKLLNVFANEYACCFDDRSVALLKESQIHSSLIRHMKTLQE